MNHKTATASYSLCTNTTVSLCTRWHNVCLDFLHLSARAASKHRLNGVSPYALCLINRHSVGECRLAEETPPVLSATPPAGCLLLLADRHAGRPGALGRLPQCGHQEELHAVTPGSSHFRACAWQQTPPESEEESGQILWVMADLPASVSQRRSYSNSK